MDGFGKRLKGCRKADGLTQVKLAELLLTTQSTIGKYERDELEPSMETLANLCKVLDISADYLLGLED